MDELNEQEVESLVKRPTTATATSAATNNGFSSLEIELSPTKSMSMSTPASVPTSSNLKEQDKKRQSSSSSSKYLIIISIFAFIVLLIVKNERHVVGTSNSNNEVDMRDKDRHSIMTCPNQIKKSENDNHEGLDGFYDSKNKHQEVDEESSTSTTKSKQLTPSDIEELKSTTHDGWGHNYYEFKKILYEWKSTYFSSLKSGDSIFESGCGIGLNLLMTIDILKESKNNNTKNDDEKLEDIYVYGIDYVEKSVQDANLYLGRLLPLIGDNVDNSDSEEDGVTDGKALLGSPICRGDATDLFFIPSNSFDLSYTGYIDPVVDPINFAEKLGREVEWEDLCKENGQPTFRGKRDQAAVEDWYAKWITELVRITKPGKPIIAEQVSLPTCTSKDDWGGVAKNWWKEAVGKYEWDVVVDSIVIKNLYQGDEGKNGRYNVYMEKER